MTNRRTRLGAELEALGVVAVEADVELMPGDVLLASQDVGFESWTALEDAIEVRAARKAGQLAKAPPGTERILFLWVSDTRGDLMGALGRWTRPLTDAPPRSLKLPDEVDTVIVGALAEDSDRLYRYPGFTPFSSGIGLAVCDDKDSC